MKNYLLAAALALPLLFGSGYAPAFAAGCCVGTSCTCVKGNCCVNGKCGCKADCCAKGGCQCANGQCGAQCNCQKK